MLHSQKKRYKSCSFWKGKLLYILGADIYILGANMSILGPNMDI